MAKQPLYIGAERRTASPEERQQWLLRQAPWIQRAMNTTILTAAGSFSGLMLGSVSATLLVPQALAQSPITFAPGGQDIVLWAVVTSIGGGLLGVLVWQFKSWVDRTNAKLDAQDVAITGLREKIAYFEGQHSPSKSERG